MSRRFAGVLRSPLAQPLKRAASGALNIVDPLTVARWRHKSGETEAAIPPRRLRARVGDPAVATWVPSGKTVAGELATILDDHGHPLSGFRSICDFGCGSGRVLQAMEVGPEARLHGMDVDAEAIAWLASNGRQVDARPNPPKGPAPFAEDSFDFLCSISIFTHLNADSQRVWLAEVARMLKPGGVGLLTVLGSELLESWARGLRPGLNEAQRLRLAGSPALRDAGFVFAPEERTRWNRWRYRGVEPDYGLAFWDHETLRREWSQWLDVLTIEPGSINWRQDAVVVRAR